MNLLGTGTYGAVFRALDLEVEREVALKIAWPSILADADASRRFIAEARTVASLKHPGIVQVYDAGEIDMIRYIAFEFIDGPTLAEWMKQQDQIPARWAAELGRSIAEAVGFAHRCGIIHRDLKPSNILLRPCQKGIAGVGFEPVVTDFGLARRPRFADAGLSGHTNAFAVIGTDRYMSPEQAAGQSQAVGPASDVFSMGVMLYELVAGRRPFDGHDSEEIRRRIREDEPPSLAPWRNSIPQDLDTIISHCLEKLPGARYANAGPLAEDLRRLLNQEPILAKPTPHWRKGWQFLRRWPKTVAATLVFTTLLFVVSGLIGALINQRMAAQRELENERARAAVADEQDRLRQYAEGIRRAADALDRSAMPELTRELENCKRLAHGDVNLGFEWYYLRSRFQSTNRVVEVEPDASVNAVKFLPGDAKVIAGCTNGKLVILDSQSGKILQRIAERDGAINELGISPSEKLIATAGADGRVIVRDISSMDIVRDAQVLSTNGTRLAWLGDDRRVAVAGTEGELGVLNVEDGSSRKVLLHKKIHSDDPMPQRAHVFSLAYATDRNLLLVGANGLGIQVVHPDTLEQVDLWLREEYSFTALTMVEMSPQHVIAFHGNRNLRFIRTSTNAVISRYFLRFIANVNCYSPLGQTLFAGGEDGRIESWHVLRHGTMTLNARRSLTEARWIRSMDASRDGARLAIGHAAEKLTLLDAEYLRDPFDVHVQPRLWGVQFSPCGRWMALLDSENEGYARLTLVDLSLGKRIWERKEARMPPLDEKEVWPMTLQRLQKDYEGVRPAIPNTSIFKYLAQPIAAFSPDGEEVVFQAGNSSALALESASGKELRAYALADDFGIQRINYSADGARVVARNKSGDAVQWDRHSAVLVPRHWKDDESWLGTFSRNGKSLELITNDGGEFYYRPVGGGIPTPLTGASDRIRRAAVSPDGNHVVAAGKGVHVYLWDLSATHESATLSGNRQMVEELLFTPDGQTIVARGGEGSVRFWHRQTRTELLSLGSADEAIICMGIHPSGGLCVIGERRQGDHEFGWCYGLRIHHLKEPKIPLPSDHRKDGIP